MSGAEIAGIAAAVAAGVLAVFLFVTLLSMARLEKHVSELRAELAALEEFKSESERDLGRVDEMLDSGRSDLDPG